MSDSSDTVLLSGFEPFGGESVNPSAVIAEALHGESIRGHRVESVVLPVSFAASFTHLQRAAERLGPKLIVCLGQAGGEPGLCIERVAINLQDASIPDNEGLWPHRQPIAEHGPVAYWSTLPVPEIADAIAAAGIPVRVSMSAGTFVCNHVFYGLMRFLETETATHGGFIHVPFLPEQAAEGQASLTLEMMEEATRIAIGAAL